MDDNESIMNIIKQYIRVVMLVFLVPMMASAAPYFDDNAPPSFADPIHLSPSKDPFDHGWLPRLIGLPDSNQVSLLTQHMVDVMADSQDESCTSINLHLRMMIFQHFLIYQHMLNAQHIYFNEQIAYQWAHVLAMILQESSGDSSNITDMSGRTLATNDSKTNLRDWRQIFSLTRNGPIKLNYQTNFGLTQTSADRLVDAFNLTKDQRYDTAFLEGRKGASTPRKRELNTAIAIRRLIWFYQDFAQGRILESEGRIHQQDINQPAFSTRYKAGLDTALLYCGTRFMFRGKSLSHGREKMSKLQHAMTSIAYCQLGNQQTGYGRSEVDEKCFAAWVTLCPALNIDIATLTPLSYFATRGATPRCEGVFKRLINKRPENEQHTHSSLNLEKAVEAVLSWSGDQIKTNYLACYRFFHLLRLR